MSLSASTAGANGCSSRFVSQSTACPKRSVRRGYSLPQLIATGSGSIFLSFFAGSTVCMSSFPAQPCGLVRAARLLLPARSTGVFLMRAVMYAALPEDSPGGLSCTRRRYPGVFSCTLRPVRTGSCIPVRVPQPAVLSHAQQRSAPRCVVQSRFPADGLFRLRLLCSLPVASLNRPGVTGMERPYADRLALHAASGAHPSRFPGPCRCAVRRQDGRQP